MSPVREAKMLRNHTVGLYLLTVVLVGVVTWMIAEHSNDKMADLVYDNCLQSQEIREQANRRNSVDLEVLKALISIEESVRDFGIKPELRAQAASSVEKHKALIPIYEQQYPHRDCSSERAAARG